MRVRLGPWGWPFGTIVCVVTASVWELPRFLKCDEGEGTRGESNSGAAVNVCLMSFGGLARKSHLRLSDHRCLRGHDSVESLLTVMRVGRMERGKSPSFLPACFSG